MVTGRIHFERQRRLTMLPHGFLTLPPELNDELNAPIEEIILHAMAPRPSDRYPSAATMKA